MAASSPSIAFIGRVLFAFLFLSSGFQKLTSFNLSTGGPVMSGMAPKMDNFLRTVDQLAGVQLPLPQVRDLQGRNGAAFLSSSHRFFHVRFLVAQGSYIFLLAIAIFLELAGGLLFIFNSTLGAVLLVSRCPIRNLLSPPGH